MMQIKYIFTLTVLSLFLSVFSIKAGGTYHLTPGDTKSLSFSTSRVINSAGWYSNRPNDVQVSSYGVTTAQIKALRSFSGYAIIRCDYYYWQTSGTYRYLVSGYEDFNIYVDPINPTNISIQSSRTMNIGDYVTLTATLTPSNAETTLTWSSNNTSVATVSEGTVRAIDAGTAGITVRTSNGLYSTCQVTVSQPSFTLKETMPVNNSQDIYTNTLISTNFSLPIYQGTQYTNISLLNTNLGLQTPGTVAISGSKLTFTPSQMLYPNTNYKFTIPTGAIKNQWGTSFASAVEVKFKTAVLEVAGSIPKNGVDKVPLNQVISCNYNTNIQAGENYDNILLIETVTNDIVPSFKRIKGSELTIIPETGLKYLTKYKIVIPANSLNNDLGNPHTRSDVVEFTTLSKLNLSANPAGGLVTAGEKVSLTANVANANIYYTLDGTEPTVESTLYTGPIEIEKSLTLKAIAFLEGYEESTVLTVEYQSSFLALISSFSGNNTKYVRRDANLAYTFNYEIRKSEKFDDIVLTKKNDNVPVTGEKIISDNTLYFVPDELLECDETYLFTIPDFAVETNLKEPNVALIQTFTTGSIVSSISAGYKHSTAIKMDSSLWTWGSNGSGQLGDGTTTDRITPIKIMKDVITVSTGWSKTTAIKTDGSLWAWGDNAYGRLGDGTTINKSTPIKIMDDVAAISTGEEHTMAIKTDGSLWAWGSNITGQLGDGTTIGKTTPVKIMDNVIAVSAGGNHTMVIKTDGSLWAWGSNYYGQLGNGTTADKTTPIKIMDNVIALSAGSCHSMAIKNDGSLWSWGENEYGQLGNGTTTNRTSPIKIMEDVAVVSAGYFYTTAIKTDGSLWTWGSNSLGQLGNGTTTSKASPTKIMEDVAIVSAGYFYAIAIKTDGSLWSWGGNPNGQLGDGTIINKKSPVRIWTGSPSSSFGADITLDKKQIQLLANHKTVLLPTIEPSGSEYGTSIQWSSDDDNIATVSQRGVITAIAPGSATITATMETKDGKNLTTPCEVTVINVPELTGTVTIMGDCIYGQTLTAITTGLSTEPAGYSIGMLSYLWTRNGVPITETNAQESTYTLTVDDIDNIINAIVTAENCVGNVISGMTEKVAKESQNAPPVPSMAMNTATSITLNEIPDAEYSLNPTDGWQESVLFENLMPKTDYIFYARLKETPTHYASTATISEVIYTKSALSIKENQFNPLQAWTHNGLLYIRGLIAGNTLSVYSITGKLVHYSIVTSDEIRIPLNIHGIYFLKSGSESLEVIVE